jgi:Arc/MetJ-type ribon-helix-helix transcriptional regulator
MERHNKRIALRLAAEQKEMIEQLISHGQFKNLSAFVRFAITDFLEKQRRVNSEP